LETAIKFLIILTLGLAQGCASAKKGQPIISYPPSRGESTFGPPEAFGPPTPEPPPSYGPVPVQLKPIVLVLGPGLARGFAYVGVFQALHESKIPIGAVLGTEIGSLIGTLYTASNSINQFEWGLLKFKEDIFQEKQGFLSSFQESQSQKFGAQLRRVFGEKDLSQLKVPTYIIVQSREKGMPILLNQGNIVQGVRGAMAAEGLFPPSQITLTGGEEIVVTAQISHPFFVHEARNLGIGPVITINVLNNSELNGASDELKDSDLVIHPDMTGIDGMAFDRRTDAAFRGKKAILEHLSEIRQLVGLPTVDVERRR
jgi:NTE family protein